MEPQPKYREKVLIGLESAPPSFDVRSKVMGPGGANLQYITNETGAIVTIRGKGSGFIEPSTGHESLEPLHICVEHSKYEVLQAGRQLAFNLIETVQQEWSNIQQQHQQQQQTTESQQQGTVQQHVQTIPVHSQSVGSTTSVQASQTQEAVLPANSGGALQLQLPIYNPPPPLTVPPPPIHLAQAQPIQVSVGNTSVVQTQQAVSSNSSNQTTQEATSQQAIVQQTTGLQPSDIQHQIQIQPQQVYVTQGGGVIQPATIIPQQQIQPTSILAHQPQIITQSYPIQYVQASNGQMVVAYPNIMRPTDNNSSQQQQVMLVQYTPQRPVLHGRTTGQSHTIPQIVQIVNPQTGQVQHVLQHIQPQIQMQQLALATSAGQVSGGTVVGGQVLMPLQQSGQQQQILTTQQGGQPIQFATQHAQGMIIASQPHQVTVSQASLQQTERGTPQVVQQQVLRQGQGVKRRFDSGPTSSNQLPPNYQSIPPPQSMPSATMTLQTVRKGIGSDGIQQQQTMRTSQQQAQQQQQHLQHQQLLQQQQQQQQQAAQQMIQQHQQQIQVVQQSSIDESQQIDDKTMQQQSLQTDDWRVQQQQPQQQRTQYIQMQAPNSPSSNNDGNKVDQPKRGRSGQSGGGGDNQTEARTKGQIDISKQQQASYIYQQQQQQTKQQQIQQFTTQGGPTDGYSTQSYQAQGYPSLYQQPPPASFQQQPASAFNWLMPQQ